MKRIWSLVIASLIGLLSCISSVQAHGPLHVKIRHLTHQLELDSSDAQNWLLRGEYYRLDGQYDSSLHDFTKAKALLEDKLYTNLMFAEVYANLQRIDTAMALCSAFRIANPDNPRGFLISSKIAFLNGLEDSGIAYFERCIQLSKAAPPDYYITIAEGFYEKDSSNFEQNVHWLLEAEKKFGFHIVVYKRLVKYAQAAGEYELALAYLEVILGNMNRHETYLVQQGQQYEALDDIENALASYNKAYILIQELPLRARNTSAMMELETQIIEAMLRLE